METKDRIMQAAIKLFNQKGTKAVTTNHIAAAAGISPGNLYYHFRNKEEIIRAIFLSIVEFTGTKSSYGAGFRVDPSIENMEAVFKRVFVLHWEYRFLYREFNALLNRDNKLKTAIIRDQKKRLTEVRESIIAFIETGIFRSMDNSEIEFLQRSLWIIGTYWHSFLESGGKRITMARVEEGIDMMRKLLRPYMLEPVGVK
ncbi:MAG: TetR/AcrR family transcriptional regulator [Nitrospirota bacterium]